MLLINNNKFIKISGDLAFKDPEGNIIPNVWIKIIDMSIKIPDKNIYLILKFHQNYKGKDLSPLANNIRVYNNLIESFRFIQ